MTPHTLTQAEIDGLAPHGVARSYAKGTIVVAEGDSGDSLYVILSGRIKIYASDEEGAEVVFVTQGPGEYFGEMVLDGGGRSASVVTLEKSRFLVVPMASLRQIISDNPDFALSIMKKLIGRVREMTAGMKNLALMDVYGRVVRLLVELAERKEEGLVIEGRHTHQDLASRVGASREMVGRVLKDLTGGGYISMQRNKIVIHRPPPQRW